MHRGGCLLSHRSGVWFGWQWPVWAPGKRGEEPETREMNQTRKSYFRSSYFCWGGEYGNVCYTWIISYVYVYIYIVYLYIYIFIDDIYIICIYYRHIMLVSRNINVFPIYCSTTGDQICFGKTWACWMVRRQVLLVFTSELCVYIIFCKPLTCMSAGNLCTVHWFKWIALNEHEWTICSVPEMWCDCFVSYNSWKAQRKNAIHKLWLALCSSNHQSYQVPDGISFLPWSWNNGNFTKLECRKIHLQKRPKFHETEQTWYLIKL